MRKLLLFILVCSMILPLLFACGNKAGETPEDNPNQESEESNNGESDGVSSESNETDYTSLVPVQDFDGYKFRIINTENDSITWLLTILTAEEESGEVMNDAVYRRNRLIEEKYNIEITEQLAKDLGEVKNIAKKSISSGSDDYDLLMLNSADGLSLAQSGSLIEIHDISTMDITKPYYDQSMIRDLSLQNKLYYIAGDLSFTHYSATIVMFFNKKLLEDYHLESPYELVRTNNWTFDKFAEISKHTVKDLNGDGKMDEYDQYGYMSLNFLLYPAFLLAADEKYLIKDATDYPVINIGNPRFIEVYNRLLDIMHSDDRLFDADLAGNHRLQDTMFPGNQTLFWSELVNWSKILRDMNSDFGILPHPKYEASQSHYKSLTFGPSYMAVPATNPDIERTGLIIEALCAESMKSVKPVYYDTMLKTKISRDDESGEMLDIIFGNRTYELGYAYWESTAYSALNNIAKNNDRDIVSFVEKNSSKIYSAVEKTISAFDKIS